MARGVLFCLENDLPMTISPEFLTLDIILKHKEIIGSIINGSI